MREDSTWLHYDFLLIGSRWYLSYSWYLLSEYPLPYRLCEEVVQSDDQTVFLPAKWHKGHSWFQSSDVKWMSSGEARNKTMRRGQVRREVFSETFCEMGWLLSAHRDNAASVNILSQNDWLIFPSPFPGTGWLWIICRVVLILSLLSFHPPHQLSGARRHTLRGVSLLLLRRVSSTLKYNLRCDTRRRESFK